APDPVAAQPLAVTPARRAPLRIPGAPVQLTHGPGTDGRLALTFNAEPGADPAVAARTLDLLRGRGLRVTVLAVGTWLAAEPALARRLLDEGHELGNHTEHHKDLSLLTEPAVRAEIEQCAHRLFRLGGGIGPWLRSPRHRESDPASSARHSAPGTRTSSPTTPTPPTGATRPPPRSAPACCAPSAPAASSPSTSAAPTPSRPSPPSSRRCPAETCARSRRANSSCHAAPEPPPPGTTA
ncbi:polysaccharide deacetylase family protein, partial [Streptomyces sp. SA3_actF]|uniref:polysaccharide deacetylase family protein n=1 Tax=Streptomyces sp. SA3_actF TaxID=682181 RepID=UPI0002000A25